MFDEEDFKTITMTMVRDGETLTITKTFPEGGTWMEISGMYYQFLSGMGYHLDSSLVSADWS